MKLKGILKGTGLFVGGFVIGGMMMVDGDTSDTVNEKPVEVVANENVEKTNEVAKEVVKEEIKKEEPKQIVAQKIFEDESVIASYYGVENDVVKIIIENKLDVAIGVQDQTFGINGFSTTGNTNSISVTPKSKGIMEIDLEEITGMYGTPATVGGEISVFNNDSYDEITSIKFNNVSITQ